MRQWIGYAMAASMLLGFCGSVCRAQNPLAQPDANQKPFVGTFTGDKIKVELKWDDAQQAYTGWITFLCKRYACGGLVDHSQLTGVFVADGQKYPFSLGIDGDGATLSSAGKIYPLKRQDTAPAEPENPLAGGGGGNVGGNPPGPQPAPAPAGNGVGGVGIALKPDADGDLVVAGVMPGGPAEKAGVKVGSYLEAVDGKSTENMSPDQVRQLIGGPIGSKVTLTIETDTERHDVTIVRADLSGAAGPGPAVGPAPAPPAPAVDSGLQGMFDQGDNQKPPLPPAPGPAPAPQNNHNPAPQVWMKPGMRLTWWSGAAVIPGANTTLIPDDNGNWKTPDGKSFSAADNPGGGGTGYQQLTIAAVHDGKIVVDMRNLVYNTETRACSSIGSTGFALSSTDGGDYWADPQKLARMQTGTQGAVRISRGPYKLGDHVFNTIRITTQVQGGYTQATYDLDSGLMISNGSCTVGAPQMTPGAGGVSGVADGNTHLMQGFFVGMRQTNLPWTGQRATPGVLGLKQVDFTGSYTTTVQMASTITWPLTSHWEIGKIDPDFVQFRQTSAIDYRNGMAPQPTTLDRGGSLAVLWIDPNILAKLQPGQVLDEDPITKMKFTVAGVQNGAVVFTEQAQTENSAVAFDQRTGLVSAMQLQQVNGPGTTTISVQRTR